MQFAKPYVNNISSRTRAHSLEVRPYREVHGVTRECQAAKAPMNRARQSHITDGSAFGRSTASSGCPCRRNGTDRKQVIVVHGAEFVGVQRDEGLRPS